MIGGLVQPRNSHVFPSFSHPCQLASNMSLQASSLPPPPSPSPLQSHASNNSLDLSSSFQIPPRRRDAARLLCWRSAPRRTGACIRRVLPLQILCLNLPEQTVDSSSSYTVPQILQSNLNVRRLIASSSGASVFETACNIIDSLMVSFLGPQSLKPSIDPKIQLVGNWAPVRETPPQLCSEVCGVLPRDLNGIYIRNGPNATRLYEHEGYHMFDGDGMLHGVKIRSGTASYCSRYVRTSRFVQEEIAGRPLFVKFFGGFFGPLGFVRGTVVLVRAFLGVLNIREGWGLSNTSVAYHGGKVLSLSEDDLPYVIQVTDEGDMITVGRLQFPRGPRKRNMCAHPKFDAETGEMFAFSFRPSCAPFEFFRVSQEGENFPGVRVPVRDLSFIHDFAITINYAIFPDNQFVVRPLNFLRGQMPVVFNKNKTPRFCVFPRDSSSSQQAVWFEVPGCNCYHYINAWDEGDEVVIITPIISPPERFLEIPATNVSCTLNEVRLNVKTGSSSRRQICLGNYEFGTFNHTYTGRKTRYVYMASGFFPELSGVAKIDLEASQSVADRGGLSLGGASIVARRDFGANCHGNEPCFVPRASHKDAAEDYGYLLCLVHNLRTEVSSLLVMDAQSPTLEIVASVQLPVRVPYGFHGCFINENQLEKQLES